MKKPVDIDKIHELTNALKLIILNEPELEAKIAVDRLLLFSRKPKFWASDYIDQELYK